MMDLGASLAAVSLSSAKLRTIDDASPAPAGAPSAVDELKAVLKKRSPSKNQAVAAADRSRLKTYARKRLEQEEEEARRNREDEERRMQNYRKMSMMRKDEVAREAREKAQKAKEKAEADKRAAEARSAVAGGGVPPPPPPPPGMGGPPPPPPMAGLSKPQRSAPSSGMPLMAITEDEDGGAPAAVPMRRPNKPQRGPPAPAFDPTQLLMARLKKTETNRKSLSIRSIDLTKKGGDE